MGDETEIDLRFLGLGLGQSDPFLPIHLFILSFFHEKIESRPLPLGGEGWV